MANIAFPPTFLRYNDAVSVSHAKSLPHLTESLIRVGASLESFTRGRELYQAGAISNAAIQGNVLSAHCEGTMEPYYRVTVELDDAGIAQSQCTCAYEHGGYCKHMIALLLTYVHKPKVFTARLSPDELLADLNRDDLLALITKLLERQPELADWIESMMIAPALAKSRKPRRKKVDAEVYRRQVRNVLHSLDRLRASEAYWGMGGLANGLRDVQASAYKFLEAGDPDTALTILLALVEEMANSHAYEYLDDSDGELGDFISGVGLPLAEAALSAELSEIQRQQHAQKLKKWMRELGDYGLDSSLDVALDALTYGWGQAPARQVPPFAPTLRETFADEDKGNDEEFEDEEEFENDEEYEIMRNGWTTGALLDLNEAKLNVLDRQGKTEEYLALSQKLERHLRYARKLVELGRVREGTDYSLKHLTMADEALTLAHQLRELKLIPEALAIGERGLKLEGHKFSLGQWLASLEEAQGRRTQALDAWLAAFSEQPSLETYKRLKQLGADSWGKLESRVMSLLDKSWDKTALAQVLLYEEQWDEAIKVAQKPDVGYKVVAIVADAVIAHRPEWVIRASKKEALELIGRTQSKYYVHAVEWLERVKKAYGHLGQKAEWRAYLDGLKLEYKRRPALQEQLKRL